MTTLGNKTLSGGLPGVEIAVNQQVASAGLGDGGGITANAKLVAPSNGWLTGLGARLKTASGSSGVYLAAWATTPDPAALLGRTAELTVTTGDSNREGAIAAAATEHDSAIRLTAGQGIALGLKNTAGAAVTAAWNLGLLLGKHNQMSLRSVGAGLPTDPFAATSTAPAGRFAFYAEFTANSAPNAPTSLAPAHAGSAKFNAVTFSGTFDDPNTAAPTLDTLWAIEFAVRDAGTLADLWSGPSAVLLASAAEQANGTFARAYAGTTLTPGQDIEWRCRCYDIHKEPGAWSAWRMLEIEENGSVAVSAPSGKIDGPTDQIAWAGTYSHPSNLAATHLQIRILKDDTVYVEGAEFAKAVSAGASFTVLANADGGIGLLGKGLAFAVQMRAKDSAGNWGRWSAGLPFATNALPTVPASLTPLAGEASTSYPTLSWVSRDPDADDVEGTDVEWQVELTWPDTTVHTYTATAYDATAGRASLAMDGTKMPAIGVYSWRVRGDDVSASDGESDWSESQTFELQAGLTVTISAPTAGQVLETLTPNVTFSIGAGSVAQRRLTLYRHDSADIVYDSGIETTGSGAFAVPLGVLFNGVSYDAVVWARNNGGPAITGSSTRRRFSIQIAAPPAPQGVAISTYQLPGTPEATAVMLSWERTEIPLDQFGGYQITRRYAAETNATTLLILQNPHQTRWIDLFAPADGAVIYGITTLRTLPNKQTIPAEALSGEIDLNLSVVVISSTGPEQRQAILRWKPASQRGSYDPVKTAYTTWGSGGLPIVAYGPGKPPRVIDDQFQLINDEQMARGDHLANLQAMYRAQETVCFRSEQERFFGMFDDFRYEVFDNKITVTLRIKEVAFKEGL